MDIAYQLRTIHTGRLVETKVSKKEAIASLINKDPKSYTVFCVHPLTGEIRSITNGHQFVVNAMNSSAKPKSLELDFGGE